MSLQPGTRLGPYEVEHQIGAGGMGEVYRAADTNLKRSVAIKVLPDSVAKDIERLARFQREAEMLARLNHPNIAHIHGIERSAGTTALVMELVDGPTLCERIGEGPVPLVEVLNIARQIALALEAAHEQGIIHRDLKPANVKIAPDETIKVLDFGLAKAIDDPASGGHSDLANSPTLTSPAATAMGLILGTAAYMAPEQAKGHRVDKRADVWAFGCVVYEMLTGRRPFDGDDVSDTLASVLKTDPDWSALPADLPAPLRTLIERCLEKDRRRRLGDISGALFVLNNLPALARPLPASAAAPARRRGMWTVAVAGAVLACAALAAAFFSGVFERRAAPGATTRLTLLLPADRGLAFGGTPTSSVSISPDGGQVVYVSLNPNETGLRSSQLRVRSLGGLDVRDLPATFGARQPFFSPDGRWVAFFSNGELRKTALTAGNPVTIASGIGSAQWARGVWLPDNTIVFGTPGTKQLLRVTADGGTPQPLVSLEPTEDHVFPTSFLPESSSVLAWIGFGVSRFGNLDAVNIENGQRTSILKSVGPGWATSGHLVYGQDETIFAAPFDRRRLVTTGEAAPLPDSMRRSGPVPQLAFSATGTLAYVPGEGASSNVIGRIQGAEFVPLGVAPGVLFRPRVSPDGQRVAFTVREGAQSTLHVRDLSRATTTKLLETESDLSVAWHPKGGSLAVTAMRANRPGIYLRDLAGSERPLVEVSGEFQLLRLGSFSPDGSTLAYVRQTGAQHEIWTVSVADRRTEKLVSSSTVHSPAFSPNGRWLAYVSGPVQQAEVFVLDLETGATSIVARGTGPAWDRSGGTLYFMADESSEPVIMAVSVAMTPSGTPRLGAPRLALKRYARTETGASVLYAGSNNSGPGYDLFPDGQFAVVRTPDPRDAREIVIVQNWFDELTRLTRSR